MVCCRTTRSIKYLIIINLLCSFIFNGCEIKTKVQKDLINKEYNSSDLVDLFKKGNLKELKSLLSINKEDIKFTIGQLPNKNNTIFYYKIRNISNRTLFLPDFVMIQVSNYFIMDGHRWVNYSFYSDTDYSNLKIVKPNQNISGKIFLKEEIPKDINIRITLSIPEEFYLNEGKLFISKLKSLLTVDLYSSFNDDVIVLPK